VSDHCPVTEDGKTLPFAESEPGATGVELLLSLALKWAGASGAGLRRALEVLTTGPARVLGLQGEGVAASLGRLAPGSVADLCVFDPAAAWTVTAQALRSQGKHTPFGGYELPGRVRCTVVGGRIAFGG
jgi:dihydroorotase